MSISLNITNSQEKNEIRQRYLSMNQAYSYSSNSNMSFPPTVSPIAELSQSSSNFIVNSSDAAVAVDINLPPTPNESLDNSNLITILSVATSVGIIIILILSILIIFLVQKRNHDIRNNNDTKTFAEITSNQEETQEREENLSSTVRTNPNAPINLISLPAASRQVSTVSSVSRPSLESIYDYSNRRVMEHNSLNTVTHDIRNNEIVSNPSTTTFTFDDHSQEAFDNVWNEEKNQGSSL